MSRYARFDRSVLVVSFAVGIGSFVVGCGHPQHQIAPPLTSPPVVSSPTIPTPHNTVQNERLAIKSALVALLEDDAKTDHIFPSGVRVKSIAFVDGVATVDFSHEFSELANSGETVESDAQHSLRKTLGKFSSIDKMRVTVDGKPFESQATDWNTPFEVREASTSSRKSHPLDSDSASR